MKNLSRTTLWGLALLGATTIGALSTPAEAKPKGKEFWQGRQEVKEERRDVKDARRDVREADTPQEKRDARRDLREEKHEWHDAKRDNRHDNGWHRGYNDRDDTVRYGRPGSYGNGSYGSGNYGYGNGNYGYGRDEDRPTYDGWNGGNGGGYSSGRETLQGVVTDDLRGDDFIIRTSGGERIHVYAARGESGAISKGDVVRVTGSNIGGSFRASKVAILRNR